MDDPIDPSDRALDIAILADIALAKFDVLDTAHEGPWRAARQVVEHHHPVHSVVVTEEGNQRAPDVATPAGDEQVHHDSRTSGRKRSSWASITSCRSTIASSTSCIPASKSTALPPIRSSYFPCSISILWVSSSSRGFSTCSTSTSRSYSAPTSAMVSAISTMLMAR